MSEVIIEDVAETFKQELRRKWKTVFGIVLACLFLNAFLLWFIFRHSHNHELTYLDFWLFVIPWLLFGYWFKSILDSVMDIFMKQFASANGFTYEPKGTTQGLKGTLFRLSDGHEVEDVVSGIYENYPIRLFTYHYTTGSGKTKKTHHKMVFEIMLPTKLPRILLRAKNQSFRGDIETFDHKNEIKLGPPFDEAFELGADAQYEIEALEIVSPAFMQYLLNLPMRFSIEFIEDKLYIYSDKVITKGYELRYFFDIAREVTQRVAPIATRLKDDVAAMDQFYKK